VDKTDLKKLDIKQLWKDTGMTQQQMADRLDVSVYTVQKWIYGETKPVQITLDRLLRLRKKTPRI